MQAGSLILDVFKQDDSLKMGLFNQGQAAPTLRNYSRVGVSFSELKNLSLEVVRILNTCAGDKPSKLKQLKDLQSAGRLLWDHLLSRPAKEKLKSSPLCNLTLYLDEDLVYLPWELLFDGSQFLCLKFALGRLVRSMGESVSLQYRDLSESLRMLILANPKADLKSAYNEGLNIKNQFSHKVKKVQVDFKSTCIDRHYVKKNICDYDIVHFAGHSEFSRSDSRGTGWVLKDGIFNADDISKMGQSYSMPALVFSNACHSAQVPLREQTVNSGLDSEYQKASYGLACAFLFAGVRHYIGSVRKIEDNSSMVFARDFYSRLLGGYSVGESLRLSKLKLIHEYGIGGLHWVNYLLYGDPGFVFFKTARKKKTFSAELPKYKMKLFKAGLFLSAVALAVILFFWLPRINPTSHYLFSRANAEFKKGNNPEVVRLLSAVLAKSPALLEAYPLAADAYQKLGNKQEALKFYSDYMLNSQKLRRPASQLDAYIKLGWFYQIDGQAAKAKEYYEKALLLSRQSRSRQAEAVALRKLAVWNIEKSDYDQALDLLIKSAFINLEYQHDQDSLKNLACDYFDLGLVFTNKNDYAAAKNFYEKSLNLFKRLKLESELSDCYYNLGEIYLLEKQYQKALDYYFKGMQLDLGQGNKPNLASGYNMIAELYMEIDDLVQAEKYFKLSIELSRDIQSPLDLAAASHNLGILYKKRGRKNLTRQYWRQAQEIYYGSDQEKYQQIRRELSDLNEN